MLKINATNGESYYGIIHHPGHNAFGIICGKYGPFPSSIIKALLSESDYC